MQIALEFDSDLFESIQNECDHDQAHLWESDCQILFEVVAYQELVQILIKKVENLEVKYLHMKQQIQQLEKKQKLLEDKLDETKMRLMVGQLAYEIDKEVLHNVLSDMVDVKEKCVCSISDMKSAIKGKDNYDDIFEDENDRLRAKKKWDDLKAYLEWEGKHFRYLKSLKSFGVQDAHPDFNPEAIKQALMNGALKTKDGQDKKLLEKCLEMHKHLCERNSQHIVNSISLLCLMHVHIIIVLNICTCVSSVYLLKGCLGQC